MSGSKILGGCVRQRMIRNLTEIIREYRKSTDIDKFSRIPFGEHEIHEAVRKLKMNKAAVLGDNSDFISFSLLKILHYHL